MLHLLLRFGAVIQPPRPRGRDPFFDGISSRRAAVKGASVVRLLRSNPLQYRVRHRVHGLGGLAGFHLWQRLNGLERQLQEHPAPSVTNVIAGDLPSAEQPTAPSRRRRRHSCISCARGGQGS